MADVALAVLAPLAAIGAVALIGGAVWLWRRGGRTEQEEPAGEFAGLAVARSEQHAAEVAELRRTVARQREALKDMAEQLGERRIDEKVAARAQDLNQEK